MNGKRSQKVEAPALILVHDAWMDGSGWREVIALLHRKGWDATAAQSPLTSLTEDVDTVIRVIERQRNGVILVGHGYGGSVISQAGVQAKVHGLIYIAAIVPAAGESSREALNSRPNSGYCQLLKADSRGFIELAPAAFVDFFSHDLPGTESRVLAATQVPVHERVFTTKLTASAGHTKPAFYVLAEKDRMLPAAAQQQFIDCIHAESVSIATGHVPLLARPQETADRIMEGVRYIIKRRSRRDDR